MPLAAADLPLLLSLLSASASSIPLPTTFHTAIIMGGHGHVNPEAQPIAQQDIEAMKAHQIPVAYRDTCAHLLINLNTCRRETYFNPNACGHWRHTYEECEYVAWEKRVADKKKATK